MSLEMITTLLSQVPMEVWFITLAFVGFEIAHRMSYTRDKNYAFVLALVSAGGLMVSVVLLAARFMFA